jgi:disulfide bond formation protein DsbB
MNQHRPGKRPEAQEPWRPRQGSGFKETAVSAGIGWLIAMPMIAFGAYLIYPDWAANERARVAEIERRQSHIRLVQSPAGETLPVPATAHGRDLFLSTCAACHSADGKGVWGLGKDLTASWFVASLDDAHLRRFLEMGRSVEDRTNTTGLPMPPKGNRPELTESDLNDLVLYLRGLQDPRRLPQLPEPVLAVAPATEEEKAKALAAAGGDAELAEYIAHGSKVFASSCSACHGATARGVPGQGKDLVDSEFCKSLDDDSLLAFIKKGRDPSDPANTTKVGMPPKGGNPALSDDDLLDVIAFVRSLQTASTKP